MASKATIDRAFNALVQAAVAGERCPITKTGTAPHGTLPQGATSALAREGKISIEIYPHNFRRVTILVGPHAGKSTAACPNRNWRPYKIIDKNSRPTSYARTAT